MNNEHIEYDRDVNPYPSFGKKYNGEKAIISLTSWKGRINTVAKTLYSLIKQCPGFHIVLVLSEEEFPSMMDEIPDSLNLFVENEFIEILWVYHNYRSFKKWMFTAQKYDNVPIITADDGCVYIRNYAEELYNVWLSNKDKIISITKWQYGKIVNGGGGCGILFPPSDMKRATNLLLPNIVNTCHDDGFYGVLSYKLNIKWIFLYTLARFIEHPTFINCIKDDKTSIWKNGCSDVSIDYYIKLLHV